MKIIRSSSVFLCEKFYVNKQDIHPFLMGYSTSERTD